MAFRQAVGVINWLISWWLTLKIPEYKNSDKTHYSNDGYFGRVLAGAGHPIPHQLNRNGLGNMGTAIFGQHLVPASTTL
jgi:hypothetical protein